MFWSVFQGIKKGTKLPNLNLAYNFTRDLITNFHIPAHLTSPPEIRLGLIFLLYKTAAVHNSHPLNKCCDPYDRMG